MRLGWINFLLREMYGYFYTVVQLSDILNNCKGMLHTFLLENIQFFSSHYIRDISLNEWLKYIYIIIGLTSIKIKME